MLDDKRGLSSELLNVAVQASANGIVITDRAGTIQWVNPAFTAMTGYPQAEAIGANPRILKSGKHDEAFYRELWDTVGAGRSWQGRMTNRRRDGTEYVEDMTVTPICDRGNGGGITHFIAIKQDVTLRVQAEQELRDSQERLELGLQAANQGLWDWNVVTGRAYFSPTYCRMLGYEPGEVDASYAGWCTLVHPDDLILATRTIQEYLEGHSSKYEVEFRFRRKDGNYVRILSRGEVVTRDASGRPVRMIGVHTDITERVKLEQQLRQAQKMEAIGLLAGGVAHDFNNLLTVINGYSDLMLSSEMAPDAIAENLRIVRQAGDRATALVRQLLSFSRRQLVEPVILDLNFVVTDLARMLQRLVPENIKFTTNLDPGLAYVLADTGQMQQVLMNLVVNSRDAMVHGGRLDVETANIQVDQHYTEQHFNIPQGSYVLLAVTDTGCGMDADTQEHLFEPFFTTKPHGVGTGLGLSTVYGIVKQSGGWIWVYSEKNKGTCVKIYLPRAEGQMAVPEEKTVPTARGTGTILVVEDNSDVRRFTAAVLERRGYSVLVAGSGTEAAAVAESFNGSIDLLLTDVVLPGANGREIADQLRILRPDLAVLYVSGYTHNIIVTEGVLQQGVEFLQKPFGAAALCARVREVIQKHNRSVRVLVVDDEVPVLRLLQQILIDAGYRVDTAENGRQALRAMQDGPVDLVISDLVMPEQEGLETIMQLRAKNPALRIIAMSGAFGGQFLNTARLLGADATLMKPISAVELVSLVRKVLRSSQK